MPNKLKVLVIEFFCAWCMTRREQTYEKSSGNTEYYRCNTCHHLNTVVAR